MTSGLNIGRLCPHCGLPGFDPVEQRDGWCGFCRHYASEGRVEPGRIPVFRLRGHGQDRAVEQCEPAKLGGWMTTGREALSYSTVRLRSGEPALLKTMFLCVDYWPTSSPVPLLFETVLVQMSTGRTFDGFTLRYGTYEEAVAGHRTALKRVSLATGSR